MEHPIIISSSKKIYKGKDGLIARLISTTLGKQMLARAMVSPLRTGLDYSSIARKTFLVEQLPSGALPVYDKDPEVLKAERVTIPEFEIFANPTVRIADVKLRRFNIIDRHRNQKTINRSGYKSITIW